MASLERIHNIVFLGDMYAGKSSIDLRIFCDDFHNDYRPTIGLGDWSNIVYLTHLDDRTVRFRFWDTSGQEQLRYLIPVYIRHSSIAVIVFDLANKQTFNNVESWIEIIENVRGNDVIMVLVGNKTDKVEERCVTWEEAAAKATDLGAMYIEVSAKTGVNIKNLFNKIAWWLETGERAASNKKSIP